MIKRENYEQPMIEVIDILSRYGVCMDFDDTVSTSEQLGKQDILGPDYEDDGDEPARSLWDD